MVQFFFDYSRALSDWEGRLGRGDFSPVPTVFAIFPAIAVKMSLDLHDDLPRHLREDTCVEVLEDLALGIVKFDPLRGRLITFAKCVASRRTIDQVRRRSREELIDPATLDLSNHSRREYGPEASAIHREQMAALAAAIGTLPHNQRVAVLAFLEHGQSDRRFDGKSYCVILAGKLGVSANVVAQRFRRAVDTLRLALQGWF